MQHWFEFLDAQGLDSREVRLKNVAEFVTWPRCPPGLRDEMVLALPSEEHHCSKSTVNRKLSALSEFYRHAARHGVELGELLRTWQPAGRHSLTYTAVYDLAKALAERPRTSPPIRKTPLR